MTSAVVHVPGPVETIVERHAQTDRGHAAARHRAAQEHDEVRVVEVTHAGVDPGTVVVHLHHTSVASPTVMRPGSLVSLTLTTELELVTVLLIVWRPVEWEEAWTPGQS